MEAMEVDDTIDVDKDGQQSTNNLHISTECKYSLEEMYKQIRELSGNDCDMDEEEIKVFLQSEMCRLACPDLFEAFKRMEIPQQVVRHDVHHQDPSSSIEKKENEDSKQDTADLHETLTEQNDKSKQYSSKDNHPFSSEVEKEKNTKKTHGHKKRRRVVSSGSSSDSDAPHTSTATKRVHPSQNNNPEIDEIKMNQIEKKTPKDDGNLLTEKSDPKVHPYYLGQMGPVFPQKGKVFKSNNEGGDSAQQKKKKIFDTKDDSTRPPHQTSSNHRNSKIKPFSFYNSANANVEPGKKLKPPENFNFIQNGKKFIMSNVSVLCVDLVGLKTVFSDPSKGHSSKSDVIPLERQITIPKQKREEIASQEKLKRKKLFKPVLKKLYSKNRKRDERDKRDDKSKKRAKYEAGREVTSDPVIPNRSAQQTHINKLITKSHNTKLENTVLKKDQRQKSFQQLGEKNEQKNQMTKDLSKSKNSGPNTALKNTGSTNNQKVSHKPEVIVTKIIPRPHAPAPTLKFKAPTPTPAPLLQQIKHAPTQNLLQQIKPAQPKLLAEPNVEQKIPKFSETPYSYNNRQQTTVDQGLVAQEVDKLLRSNTAVQYPASVASELTEYTIRKIGWWLLKEEEDPPDEMKYHPEHYDHKIYEDWYNPKDHQDDDACSIGCVSDPDGTQTETRPQKEPKFLDADKLDEYAGSATLEAKIRRVSEYENSGDKYFFKNFIVATPGCNYDKSNFEGKCHICKKRLEGNRALGKHIRGKAHKNELRNYSLNFAKYEESIVKVQPKKIFVAKLTKYSTGDNLIIPTLDVAKDPRSSKLVNQEISAGINDIDGSDGPRAVINMNHPEVIQLQDIDDKLSLPSLAVFDLEPDNQQLRARICLRTNGFWTPELERKWLQMRQNETRITGQYNADRDKYINSPDSHPSKKVEWIKFWEQRCIEVEAEGKNPDDYDYAGEWVPFWLKRVQEIMKAEFEMKMLSMQKEFGLDADTLIRRCQKHNLSLDSVDIVTENNNNQHNPDSNSDIRANQAPHLPNYRFNNTAPSRTQYRQPFPGRRGQARFAQNSRMSRPNGQIHNSTAFRGTGQPSQPRNTSTEMNRQERPVSVPYKYKNNFRGNRRGYRGFGRNTFGRPRSRSPHRGHYSRNDDCRNDRRRQFRQSSPRHERRSWNKSTKPHFFSKVSNRTEKPHEQVTSLGAAPSSEFTANAVESTSRSLNPNQQSGNGSNEERPRDFRNDITYRESKHYHQTHLNSKPERRN